ncbi:hypothetical protein [Streptomyces sp. NPDC091215]|uniref:hypothetical protein n=1 Tax=Streptomyces sp. NPDC091215 TaxID=3155192 RepID=UPI00343FA06E
MLLFQCQMLAMLDNVLPGCQRNLLEQIPEFAPPPVRNPILTKVIARAGMGDGDLCGRP